MAEHWVPGGGQGQVWKEACPAEPGSSPGSPWSVSKASEVSGGDPANGASWAILAARAAQQQPWPPQGGLEGGSWAPGVAEAGGGGGGSSARSAGGSSRAASPTFADTARLQAVVQHQQQQLEAAGYRAGQAEDRVVRLEQLAIQLASDQTVLQGQLEAARRDLQEAEARAASAAQSSATNPQLAQYLSVTLQQLQLVTERREAAEGERDRLAAAHARLVQTLEQERGERERQAALAQQQLDEARREQRRLSCLVDDQARQLGQQHAQLQELQQELLLWQLSNMSFGGHEGSNEEEEEEEEKEEAVPAVGGMWRAAPPPNAGFLPMLPGRGQPVPPPPPPPPAVGARGPLFGMPLPAGLIVPLACPPAPPPAERRSTQLRPTAKPFEPPPMAAPPAAAAAAAPASPPSAALPPEGAEPTPPAEGDSTTGQQGTAAEPAEPAEPADEGADQPAGQLAGLSP